MHQFAIAHVIHGLRINTKPHHSLLNEAVVVGCEERYALRQVLKRPQDRAQTLIIASLQKEEKNPYIAFGKNLV